LYLQKYLYAGNFHKNVQKKCKGGKWRGSGPWAHLVGCPTPLGIARCPSCPTTSLIHGRRNVAHQGGFSTLDPMSVWSEGQGGASFGMVAHLQPHTGGNRPKQPTYLKITAIRKPCSTIGWRQWIQGSADAPWPPTDFLHCLQVSPLPIHTIKEVWNSMKIINKHSSYTHYSQAQGVALEVVDRLVMEVEL
jgi:hypothetical protein